MSQILAVYRVDFTEYERGWGNRPDNFTLSLTKEIALKHKREYETGGNSEIYQRGSEPILVEVNQELYDFIKNSDKGVVWMFKSTKERFNYE